MSGCLLLLQTVLGQAGLSTADTVFQWFWTAVVFASIAWYAILLFWLGTKGGIEIRRMIRVLKQHIQEKESK
jgi:hypothetical protein